MSFLVDFFRTLNEVMCKSGKDCNTHSPREHRLRHALPHIHGGTNLRIAWKTIVGLWLITVTQVTLIIMAYVILGMFMDAIGMLILTLPVTFPAVIALNGGPNVTAEASAFGLSGENCAIWFGIIVVKMAELCLITPPIGLNCFVVAGVRPDISAQDVFRGASPFFVADVVTVAVLIAFPAITLWLPNLLVS